MAARLCVAYDYVRGPKVVWVEYGDAEGVVGGGCGVVQGVDEGKVVGAHPVEPVVYNSDALGLYHGSHNM